MAGFGSLAPVPGVDAVPTDLDGHAEALRILANTWPGQLITSTAAPGQAVSGAFDTKPTQPGMWSDEDEARAQMNDRAVLDKAGNLATFAAGGAVPAVMARGVEGMASRPVFGSLAGAGALERAVPPSEPFFSATQRAVEASPLKSAPGAQWAGTLKNTAGVKPDEVAALGLDKRLAGPEPVTKEDLLAHIEANKVKLDEVVKGGPSLPATSPLDHPAIQDDIRLLREHGVEPTANPDDIGVLGFVTREDGPWAGDILTAEEFAHEHASAPNDAVTRGLMRASERVEDFYHRNLNWNAANSGSRFSQWQLPGGENYRETLLKLPERTGAEPAKIAAIESEMARLKAEVDGRPDPGLWSPADSRTFRGLAAERDRLLNQQESASFKSSHWPDDPNTLVHYRSNDRMIPDATGAPQPTHFLEEVQSDWHQRGRKNGYAEPAKPIDTSRWTVRDAGRGRREVVNDDGLVIGGMRHDTGTDQELIAAVAENEGIIRTAGQVPDAPFKKTWPELALKHAIRRAVDKGQTQVAWTPGHVQASRYDLAQHIDNLRTIRNEDGSFDIGAIPKGQSGPHREIGQGVPAERLEDYVGKDMAEKIQNDFKSQPAETQEQLAQDYRKWLDEHGYPQLSADEQNMSAMPKEHADHIVNFMRRWDSAGEPVRHYSGLDLHLPHAGMNGFYDQMLPSIANKLGKKYGTQTHRADMTTGAKITADHIHSTAPGSGGLGDVADEIMGQHYNDFGEAIADAEQRVKQDDHPEYQKYAKDVLAELTAWRDRAQKAAGPEAIKSHVLPITPELAAAAKRGFPLFSAGAPIPPQRDQ